MFHLMRCLIWSKILFRLHEIAELFWESEKGVDFHAIDTGQERDQAEI